MSMQVALPKSSADVLLILVWVPNASRSSSTNELVTARSYAGYGWEGVYPNPVQPTCNTSCHVPSRLSTEGHYRVNAFARPIDVNQAASIARFLLQSSFGPTRALISSILASEGKAQFDRTNDTEFDGIEKWITMQMNLPPTLHRVHYRQRVNPIKDGGQYMNFVGVLPKPCDLNSRWTSKALSMDDVYKPITVVPVKASGFCYVSLYIDNVLRTQIAAFGEHDCYVDSKTYRICSVVSTYMDYVSDSDPNCNAKIRIDPPKVHFYTPDPKSTVVYDDHDVVIQTIVKVDDAFMLMERNTTCKKTSHKGHSFMGIRNSNGEFTPQLRLHL